MLLFFLMVKQFCSVLCFFFFAAYFYMYILPTIAPKAFCIFFIVCFKTTEETLKQCFCCKIFVLFQFQQNQKKSLMIWRRLVKLLVVFFILFSLCFSSVFWQHRGNDEFKCSQNTNRNARIMLQANCLGLSLSI